MELGLAGKRVLITGGTRGIGRAIVEAFAAEGASVAVCARTQGPLDDLVASLEARGTSVFARTLDVTDRPALEAFVADAALSFGGLDVYVANASGVLGRGNDDAAWQAGFDVDVMSTVRGVEAAIPHLATRGGAVVVVGTISALETMGRPSAYAAMKAALLPWAHGLAQELAPRGVRVNVVSPGQVYFEGGIWHRRQQHEPARFASALAKNPGGRMGKPEEIADAVLFLASARAAYISGANLVVDGAFTQRVS